MTKKATLGLALMLILMIPTTSLTAYATITPDAPQDGTQYVVKGIVADQYSSLFKKWTVGYGGLYPGVKTKFDLVGTDNVAYQYSKKYVQFGVTDVPLASE